MADGVVQVAPDSTGKKVDTAEITVGANTVERQRIVIADNATAANVAAVTAANALKVDGSAVTQPVSQTNGIPDLAGSLTALGSAGATAVLAVAGYQGASMSIGTGTLAGTVVPELSMDGGVTYVATQFYDPRPPVSTSTSLTLGGSGNVWFGIILAGGTTHVRVRVSSYISGSSSVTMRATVAETVAVAPAAPPWYYRGNSLAFAPTLTTPTDIFTIACGSGKLTYITRLQFSMVVTTAVMLDLNLIYRSTIDTAGTSSAVTAVSLDRNAPSAVSTVLGYTANPTLGTARGVIWASKYLAQLATAVPQIIDLTFPSPVVLRVNATDQLCLNLNSVTIAGPKADITVEWYEA